MPPPGPIQPISVLADRLPPPFGELLDCMLTAKSQAELNLCATQVGPSGPAVS